MSETSSATTAAAAAYQSFQGANEETIPTLGSQFTTLVSAAANNDVQPHVRVLALNLIGQHGAKFDKGSVKTALDGIIRILGDENETTAPPKLLVTAIEAFVALCKGTAAKQDDLVRVAVDLCVIIVLNNEGFSQAARDAAEGGLKQLTAACPVGVVKKYLHLLSDEREKDEDDQLERERAFALARLQALVADRTHLDQWTEEAQTSIQSFLASVISTAQKDELKALCQIFTKLSSLGDGTFFVDKLLKAKLDNARLFEALVVVAPFVPRTVTHAALAEKLLSLVAGTEAAPAPAPKKGGKKAAAAAAPAAAADGVDLASDATAAVAFLFAARTASAELAEKVASTLIAALEKALPALAEETDSTDAAPEGLPENLTAVEAILLGLATIAAKNAAYVTEKLSADTIVAQLNQTYKAIGYYKKVAVYAAKKQQLDGTPSTQDLNESAVTITVLTNLAALVGPLTTKHLPSATLVPSWEKSAPLPRVAGKKSARESILSSILPTNGKAEHKATPRDDLLATTLPVKKARAEEKGSNNRNHNGNQSRKQSHSRGGRRF